MLHDIAITQTSMCRRITSSSCFMILVWFTSEYFFRLCCRLHLCSVLERTTDSKGDACAFDNRRCFELKLWPVPGHIKERTWYGDDGMQHVRTIKKPIQSIPTFAETIALLMKVCYMFPVFLLPSPSLELSNLNFCSLRINM